jgi:hypothetical protein
LPLSFKDLAESPVEVPMLYSQSPPLTADEMAFDGLARDLGVHSDQRAPRRRPKPASDSSYSYRFGEGQPVPQSRPSIGRRMFRTLIRFSIAVLIGVGATLGWQSYGDEIREILIAQAPAVGMLLPVPSTRPPVSTAAYGDPARQLAPMASTLDAVRRSVEQLAAKQEQIAQNIVALRAVEEEVRQKLLPASSTAATPPAPPPQAASAPQPKPPQSKIDSRLSPPPGSQFSR